MCDIKSQKLYNSDDMWNIPEIINNKSIKNDIQNFRNNGLTCGVEVGLLYTDRKNTIEKKIKNNILYDEEYQSILVKRFDNLCTLINDPKYVTKNLECEVGNPQYCVHNSMKLNTNDLYNIYDCWQATRLINAPCENVLEIGGGFGGLSNKLLNNLPIKKLILVDLYENLLLQHYYLSSLHKNKKIIFINDANSFSSVSEFDILLVTPDFCSNILTSFKYDLIVQTRGFSEMNKSFVKYYFDIIQTQLKDDGFLYLGSERYVAYRGVEVMRIRDYPFDNNWNIIISQPTWLTTQGHDFLLKRSFKPVTPFKDIITSFPLVSPPYGPVSKKYNIEKWTQNTKFPEEDFL
jgi:putative sugar O-methyltransferase